MRERHKRGPTQPARQHVRDRSGATARRAGSIAAGRRRQSHRRRIPHPPSAAPTRRPAPPQTSCSPPASTPHRSASSHASRTRRSPPGPGVISACGSPGDGPQPRPSPCVCRSSRSPGTHAPKVVEWCVQLLAKPVRIVGDRTGEVFEQRGRRGQRQAVHPSSGSCGEDDLVSVGVGHCGALRRSRSTATA